MPYTTYDGYERGYRQPPIEIIPKIADALGISPNDLVGWNDLIETAKKQETVLEVAKSSQKTLTSDVLSPTVSKQSNLVRDLSNLIQAALGPIEYDKLIFSLDKLNTAGQSEAVKRVEELTEIPRYQKDPSDQDGNND